MGTLRGLPPRAERVQARLLHHDGTGGLDDVLIAPAGSFARGRVDWPPVLDGPDQVWST